MQLRLALILLAPFFLHAQDGCTLGGIVVNSVTREPVRKALVYARRIGAAGPAQRTLGTTAVTDDTGRFAFAGLEPGSYNISAERGGFVAGNYGARKPGGRPVPLQLDKGKDIHDLILVIAPHGVITGHVFDEDGDPATAVQIQVSTVNYQDGQKQLVRSGMAMTNDLGEYRVYGLAPGKYFVSAIAPGRFAAMTAQKPAEEDYVTTYYPRTTDPAAAAPLTIAPGSQLRDIDLRLAKARTVSVRGRVRTEGLPAGASINTILTGRDAMAATSFVRASAPNKEQTFEMQGVAPGAYLLVASTNIHGKSLISRVPVTVGNANVDGVEVTLRGGIAVEGRVRVPEAPETDMSHWQILLQVASSGGVVVGSFGATKIRAQGEFRIEDVGSEKYVVRIAGMPEGYYIASVRSGEVDAFNRALDTSGGAPTPLEIVVRKNAGALTGSAVEAGGQPVPGAMVVLIPEDRNRRELPLFYRTVTSDAGGSFALKGLIPGDYRIYAFEEIEQSAWLDADYIQPFATKGETVTIREGTTQTVRLPIIPASDR